MKKLFILFTAIFICLVATSQGKTKQKKYPSLFWEITGNGLKKPSYLFGTMHVSSKIVFNLSDSFYIAIRNADVVALETNPETWQEDMNNYDFDDAYNYRYTTYNFSDEPNDYLNIKTLRFGKYERKLELAMFSKPSMINNLLYRTLSDYSSDFEEDTYLDLYIYQTGKKLGKKVAGVEKYEESMRLMNEAFKDAAKEKNKKEKSFDYDEDYSPAKLQEAYRTGNLDLLDSINRINSQSEAFDEKFLYKRNEIQANSIDSIIKKTTLFVGVGAAHLPGDRGVIEMLREKGYKLRPIFMGNRDGKQKDQVEKMRVPVTFTTQTANDGFYKVDIPGKFYQFGENKLLNQEQCADMANGSFYMVTRVKTNGLYWGHSTDMVAKKIDSLVYVNVPGKILSKTDIIRNGYKGFDISSRTRRGDYNRYNIFITPFEVVFFKMGGNGDYLKNGDEAKKFFGSIQLKEFKNDGWKKYQPDFGGFSIDFPQAPYLSFDDNIEFDAQDKASTLHYSVIRTDIHNYKFAEEDTFDLDLMNESFTSSEFIDKEISSKHSVYKGYPALDCKYKHKDGSLFSVRFIIQGPHYYTLVTHGKNPGNAAEKFFNSFQFTPFVYKDIKERTDTSMYFTVSPSWYPKEKENKLDLPNEYTYMYGGGDDDSDVDYFDENDYKTKYIKNDTTGESVYISFVRTSRYEYTDSVNENENKYQFYPGIDTSWITRDEKRSTLKDGLKVVERFLSDSNSSRMLRVKTYYKKGLTFQLTTATDTLTAPSTFISSFFESFSPSDTLTIIDPYSRKSKIFFEDFFSDDSTLRKKAMNGVRDIDLDSSDLPVLTKAINSFNWSEKKYLERKISFINKLAGIDIKASSDLLKQIYFNAGDTVMLQHAALETLLKQKTHYAFNLFRDIITVEPPVLETKKSVSYNSTLSPYSYVTSKTYLSQYSNGSFFDELYDSLELTKTIITDLLPLMNLNDYEKPIMNLLQAMVDSNLITAKIYESYFTKFYLEAKQEIKKQSIAETKTAIAKAENEKSETKPYNYYQVDESDLGNRELITYATLLIPFRESKPVIYDLLNKMIFSDDKRLRYNTLFLFLKNRIPVADSVLEYFAAMDDYRYKLYSDLDKLNQLKKFPQKYYSMGELAKSKLYSSSIYNKPDSLLFVDSLSISTKGATGLVFFYKYKSKKDDTFWKLADVGILNKENGKVVFNDKNEAPNSYFNSLVVPGWNTTPRFGKGFTEFSDEKIKDETPLQDQLKKQLKKISYSSRKSARSFYVESPDLFDNPSRYFE